MSVPPQFYDVKDKLFYGSLLSFIGGFIPYIGGFIALIGAILFIIGIYQFKDYNYKVWDIYKKMLIISIIFAILVVSAIFSYDNKNTTLAVLFGVVAIITIIANIYFRLEYLKTFYHITKISEFDEARNFYIMGLATLIILVGLVLLIISNVYEIMAYNKLPGKLFKNREEESDSTSQIY